MRGTCLFFEVPGHEFADHLDEDHLDEREKKLMLLQSKVTTLPAHYPAVR
jgi:hypothetical protein